MTAKAASACCARPPSGSPTNALYRIELLKQTEAYARELLLQADDARRAGRYAEATQLFTQVLQVDAANDLARRGLVDVELDMRSNRLLEEAKKLAADGDLDGALKLAGAALEDSPQNLEAKKEIDALHDRMENDRKARVAAAKARSIMSTPVTLQFRDANLRMVFEALSRTTGLNVIFDRDVRTDLRTTIFVKDATVEDTVDLILLQSQLERRNLNGNTLFIYPATAAKQKEYQDLEVRTFQIANADVKYLTGMLKSVLKLKDISSDDKSGTMVIRDTPEALAVAAKVIAAHDVPEAEVMLEVQVLEVSHDRLTNLGLQLPDSFTVATPASADTIGALRNLSRNDLTASPLSATLNLKLLDTDANLLASPRIRARNKEKARILIGDRVPIITNTVTPIQSGSSVVTGSVQYQDVGSEARVRAAGLHRQGSGHQDQPGGEQHRQGDRRPQRLARLPDRHAQRADRGAAARRRDAGARRIDLVGRPQHRCQGARPRPPAGDRQAVRQQQRHEGEERDRALDHAACTASAGSARQLGAHRVLGHRRQPAGACVAARSGGLGAQRAFGFRRHASWHESATGDCAARHAVRAAKPAAAECPASAPIQRAARDARDDGKHCRERTTA